MSDGNRVKHYFSGIILNLNSAIIIESNHIKVLIARNIQFLPKVMKAPLFDELNVSLSSLSATTVHRSPRCEDTNCLAFHQQFIHKLNHRWYGLTNVVFTLPTIVVSKSTVEINSNPSAYIDSLCVNQDKNMALQAM